MFVNSQASQNAIFAFHHDGTSYKTDATTAGLFSQRGSGVIANSLAAGDVDDDGDIDIVQGSKDGYVRVFDTATTGQGLIWETQVGSSALSTPVIVDADEDFDADVVVTTHDVEKAVVLEGADGSENWCWTGASGLPSFDATPQVPVPVSVQSASSVSHKQIVAGTVQKSSPSTEVGAALFWRSSSGAGCSSGASVLTMVDDMIVPHRLRVDQRSIVGSAVVVDYDSDDALEVIAPSSQGGLFAWELYYLAATSQFVAEADEAWPIHYPEIAGSPAVADLDADGFRELVVPVDDGYVYVYDLTSETTDGLEWGTEGHSVSRTNDVGDYGGGTRPSPNTVDKIRLSLGSSNPNATGHIVRLDLPAPEQRVTCSVFDVLGRRVVTLHDGPLEAGANELKWNGRSELGLDAPSGVYFLEVRTLAEAFRIRVVIAR